MTGRRKVQLNRRLSEHNLDRTYAIARTYRGIWGGGGRTGRRDDRDREREREEGGERE